MTIHDAAEALKKNGFLAHVFDTAEQAKAAVLELIPAGSDVGVGGSVTVQQTGLRDALLEKGCRVHWHWYAAPEERAETCRRANRAGYYLMSSNAVTAKGELVNIDGNCNRLGAMLYGPGTVVVIAGKNKLVENADEALERIKNIACPLNARRLKLDTPCAATGKCTDCRSPQRMCSATVSLHRPPGGKAFHIFLVNEEMGY